MSDSAGFHGTWAMVKATLNGEEAPELVIRKTEIVLSPGRYLVRFDGDVHDEGEVDRVPHGNADRLELRGRKGPNQGKILPALYQYRGDLLRICYGLDGAVPDDFSADAGSARYLVLYRRKH